MFSTVSIGDLASAHITVHLTPPNYVHVHIVEGDDTVSLHGDPEVVRGHLTDAVAQIDAIAAQHPGEQGG